MQEAQIEKTGEGQLPAGAGWFILNLGEMAWETVPGFGVWRGFDDPHADPSQPGMGVHVHVLQPGETNGLYHAEAAQEGFLVLSGECIAVVEGEERRMRQWDFFHSPPGTEHITVGAGDGPCAILMFGSPDPTRKVEWIANAPALNARRRGRAKIAPWRSPRRTTTRRGSRFASWPKGPSRSRASRCSPVVSTPVRPRQSSACAGCCATSRAGTPTCTGDSSSRRTTTGPTSACCSGTRTATRPRAGTGRSRSAPGPSSRDGWMRPKTA